MNAYYFRKRVFVAVATCFTLLLVTFFLWFEIPKNDLHQLPESTNKANSCLSTILNNADRVRLREISKEILPIESNLSKLFPEEADTKCVAFYIQENYPTLPELQEESMKICANINTLFCISITESPFIAYSCDSLPNMNFTVCEGIKKNISELSKETSTNCTGLLILVRHLLVANLRLFMLQGKHEEIRRVLELSANILDCVEDSTMLSLMVKLIIVENILNVYKLRKTLLPLDITESCDLYTKVLLNCVRDEIFKRSIILKNDISVLILYCRATSSDYKVAQLLIIERFLGNLIRSNEGFNMSIDSDDELKLHDIHIDDNDYKNGLNNGLIAEVLIIDTQLLVDVINRFKKLR